jgi:hypothetical protein
VHYSGNILGSSKTFSGVLGTFCAILGTYVHNLGTLYAIVGTFLDVPNTLRYAANILQAICGHPAVIKDILGTFWTMWIILDHSRGCLVHFGTIREYFTSFHAHPGILGYSGNIMEHSGTLQNILGYWGVCQEPLDVKARC